MIALHRRFDERLLFAHLLVAPSLVQILDLRVSHVDQEHGKILAALLQQRFVQTIRDALLPPLRAHHDLGDSIGRGV